LECVVAACDTVPEIRHILFIEARDQKIGSELVRIFGSAGYKVGDNFSKDGCVFERLPSPKTVDQIGTR
jgi:hypothetical protein